MERSTMKKTLTNRNIQMIALGGAIGTGLFLGSAKAIKLAGPAVLLTYFVCGLAIYGLMYAMGELFLSNNEFQSIGDFIQYYLGERWAFLVNWTYWLCWMGAGLTELTAIGLYIRFWLPALSPLISGIFALIALVIINVVAVRWFGELESLFSTIKIFGILLFILLGIGVCFLYFKSPRIGVRENFDQLQTIFPFGLTGLVAAFPMVLFSFAGVEMIGLTVGETADPQKNLKKAIQCLPARILFFYIGTIVAILLVVPWQSLDLKESPLVTMLQFIHCSKGAGVINLIILVASLSSTNSAIYSTSRILYNTAKEKNLSKWFLTLSSRGVPLHGILFTGGMFLLGLCLHFFVSDSRILFQLLAGMTTISFLFVWSAILFAHLKLTKSQLKKWKDRLILCFFGLVGISLFFEPTTRVIPVVSVVWFGALNLIYQRIRQTAPK
ncbi:amino acid permease [Enterococcus hirae]